MNYHIRHSAASSVSKTTEEIMAIIQASQQQRPSASTGIDYFATRNAPAMGENLSNDVVDETSAIPLNVNLHADETDIGATALNNKDGIKNFKAVAPLAHPATATSSDDDITFENKPLAARANEPTDKAVAVSLHSSADEQVIEGTCGADGDAEQTSESISEGDDLFDPNFYKVSIDFFDNGEVRNKTRYTAKLSIQQHQDNDPSVNDILFANFYSRSRDFKAFVEGQGCWDQWYENVYTIFGEKRDERLNFKIKPVIAILKERSYENGKTSYDTLRHTACFLYQVHGEAPVLAVIYQLWGDEIRLDAQFQKKDASAPKHKGYYVDPQRAHLALPKRVTGMKTKTPSDFGR